MMVMKAKTPRRGDIIGWDDGETPRLSLVIGLRPSDEKWSTLSLSPVLHTKNSRWGGPYVRSGWLQILTDEGPAWLYFNETDVTLIEDTCTTSSHGSYALEDSTQETPKGKCDPENREENKAVQHGVHHSID